jgi:soluble lytic murein transglycosylase-like protein
MRRDVRPSYGRSSRVRAAVPRRRPVHPVTAYRAEIETAAKAQALDPDLVEALVLVESAGRTTAYRYEPNFFIKYMAGRPEWKDLNPERVSASYGLMQVLFVVAVEVGYTARDPEHLFVPSIGLEYGCRKLAQLLTWSDGNVTQALAAYNGGRGGNGKPPFRNQVYADRVVARLAGPPTRVTV